jgi:DnaK suppressor protein
MAKLKRKTATAKASARPKATKTLATKILAKKAVATSKPSKSRPKPVPAKTSLKSSARQQVRPASVKRAAPKKMAKPAARKAVTGKPAPVKTAKRPAARPAATLRKKISSGKASKSRTGSKIAVGVVAAGAAAAGAAGMAAISAASKKRSGKKQARSFAPVKIFNMQNNGKNNQKKEVGPGGGIVLPATKTAPAMRLTANDAEILATAKERYSTRDLEQFRKLLIDQRQEAKEEFDILSQNIMDTSGEFEADNQTYSLHTAEQGSDAIEREKTFLHAQRTSDYIKKLDEALERIDRGTYGICVICGGLIEKQRLQAVPITQKHVDCKNKTNAKRIVSGQSGSNVEDAITNAE